LCFNYCLFCTLQSISLIVGGGDLGSKTGIPGMIASEIGSKIVSGALKPGVVLDGEVEACGERSVSRSAYREAVRILVAKGLLESRPKVGTRVTQVRSWHLFDTDLLSWMFAQEPPSDLLANLFELRKLIEPEAAGLAAVRRSPQQLARMGSALELMTRDTLHTESGRAADEVFHSTLLSASENIFLVTISTGITAAITWSTLFKARTHRLDRDALPDHVKVFEAIAARDVNAARTTMLSLINLAYSDCTLPRTRANAPKRRARR